MAQEISELRVALKVDFFDAVIGHSAGANIAVSYALHDRQPKKLIGLNPYFTRPSSKYYFLIKFLPAFILYKLFCISGSENLFFRVLDSSNTNLTMDRKMHYAFLVSTYKKFRSQLAFIVSLDKRMLLKRCNAIECETTFLVSRDDGWLSSDSLRSTIFKNFINTQFIEIMGGHIIHEGNPHLAIKILKGVLLK